MSRLVANRPISTAHSGVVSISPSPRDALSDYDAYCIDGWDGYDALAISAETVAAARRFYRLLHRSLIEVDIAPGADGTIGFEWRRGRGQNSSYIFVEVGPGSVISGFSELSGRCVDRWEKGSAGVTGYRIASDISRMVNGTA